MTPFECYIMYSALKAHFVPNGTYNYFKYQKKIKRNPATFDAGREKFYFLSLTKKYTDEDLEDFLIANVSAKPNVWAGALLSEQSHDVYMEYKRRKQSLSYLFKQDLDTLRDLGTWSDLFHIEEGQNPPILNAVYTKSIEVETFIILETLFGFFERLTNELHDDIIWPSFRNRCEKLAPFISIDRKKYTKMAVDTWTP